MPKNDEIAVTSPSRHKVPSLTGTLIERPSADAPQFALLWVKDGILYTIGGLGSNSQKALEIANSLP